jgi:hypothetical protein
MESAGNVVINPVAAGDGGSLQIGNVSIKTVAAGDGGILQSCNVTLSRAEAGVTGILQSKNSVVEIAYRCSTTAIGEASAFLFTFVPFSRAVVD